MLTTLQRACGLFLGLAVLFSGPALSHALLVSAHAGQEAISGQAFYSDGTPAADEAVELFSPPDSKQIQLSVQTNGSGNFTFSDLSPGSYRVVAYGMEGHRAQADILLQNPRSADNGTMQIDAADIALLRQDIARLEARIRLSDIVGGIGYIVGLAGLYLFYLRRRKP
ncbi:carboxypeptidase-like regulatory domain-containing protein [Paenalcaligenes niemegkensis]|uniref:carboxypeptidase-like regulatory domain-containing protein n=1 Tax=Paenalcaligenes niemegkensis TaxID=2895469 RepID=UPI001EE834F1|nr:carboxypeptidase-like regulatory domain-containing protein [Paenalcaligenes niemegkensis]MCQ9617580.1 carboxypeptidase-like regulatory domain-containing protein [Paenalcaligenes niemegkensis]